MLDNCWAICDRTGQAFFSGQAGGENMHFVTSLPELECLVEADFTNCKGVIVFAELLWDGHSYSDFYGIDVAVMLRLRWKLLAPICILSFMPKSFFLSQNEIKFNILKARGTCFLPFPNDPQLALVAMESIHPLSQATLTYLSNLLVDVQHIIDLLRHDLRMTASHEKIAAALKRVDLLSTTSIYHEVRSLAADIDTAHAEGDENRFYSLFSEMVSKLGLFLQQTKHTRQHDDAVRHRIVIVDDNLDDLNWAKAALGKSFDVVSFLNVMEAKQYIDEDMTNEISAVICDWQLLRPGTNEQQEMLGFELLDYASKKGHYALFSLTSTDDTSTREVDMYLDFEHTLITKDFHHDEALWKMYIPIIQQKIDRTTALIASLPTGEAWTNNFKLDYRKENGKKVAYKKYFKSFSQQYVEQRNSTGWHSFENEISSTATQLWHYYEKAFDPDNSSELFDLKAQWGVELNRELRNVLIVRRLFLAFWFNKTKLDLGFRVPRRGWVEDPVINIYSVLRHRYFYALSDERDGVDDEKLYKDLNNAAKVFVNQLAIEPNRLPQGVLPEEKAWLKGMGIDLATGNDNSYYFDL